MENASLGGEQAAAVARRYRRPADMHVQRKQELTFGQKAADTVSNFAGSWRFITIYMCLTAAWCGLNVLTAIKHWDPYPYIFYTFSVSVLAILMSSLILLAGNRQAEVDRSHAENAYHHIDEVNAKQDDQLQILRRQLDLIQSQIETATAQHSEILQLLGSAQANGQRSAQ